MAQPKCGPFCKKFRETKSIMDQIVVQSGKPPPRAKSYK